MTAAKLSKYGLYYRGKMALRVHRAIRHQVYVGAVRGHWNEFSNDLQQPCIEEWSLL